MVAVVFDLVPILRHKRSADKSVWKPGFPVELDSKDKIVESRTTVFAILDSHSPTVAGLLRIKSCSIKLF